MPIYRKFDESKLTPLELRRFNYYKEQHKDKSVYLYYTTCGTLGYGFNIIATIDKPQIKNGDYDWGKNYSNITDIDVRIEEF